MYTRLFTLLGLFALSLLLGSCNYASTLTLTDGKNVQMELTKFDGTFIYGVTNDKNKATKVLHSDVMDIEYPGENHVVAGAVLTGLAGAFTLGGLGILATADGYGGVLGIVMIVFGAAPTAAVGIPVLVWGVIYRNEARENSGWEEAMQSIRPAPIVLSDGEKNHYGVGISGRF